MLFNLHQLLWEAQDREKGDSMRQCNYSSLLDTTFIINLWFLCLVWPGDWGTDSVLFIIITMLEPGETGEVLSVNINIRYSSQPVITWLLPNNSFQWWSNWKVFHVSNVTFLCRAFPPSCLLSQYVLFIPMMIRILSIINSCIPPRLTAGLFNYSWKSFSCLFPSKDQETNISQDSRSFRFTVYNLMTLTEILTFQGLPFNILTKAIRSEESQT